MTKDQAEAIAERLLRKADKSIDKIEKVKDKEAAEIGRDILELLLGGFITAIWGRKDG
jgi:hypothetical protein